MPDASNWGAPSTEAEWEWCYGDVEVARDLEEILRLSTGALDNFGKHVEAATKIQAKVAELNGGKARPDAEGNARFADGLSDHERSIQVVAEGLGRDEHRRSCLEAHRRSLWQEEHRTRELLASSDKVKEAQCQSRKKELREAQFWRAFGAEQQRKENHRAKSLQAQEGRKLGDAFRRQREQEQEEALRAVAAAKAGGHPAAARTPGEASVLEEVLRSREELDRNIDEWEHRWADNEKKADLEWQALFPGKTRQQVLEEYIPLSTAERWRGTLNKATALNKLRLRGKKAGSPKQPGGRPGRSPSGRSPSRRSPAADRGRAGDTDASPWHGELVLPTERALHRACITDSEVSAGEDAMPEVEGLQELSSAVELKQQTLGGGTPEQPGQQGAVKVNTAPTGTERCAIPANLERTQRASEWNRLRQNRRQETIRTRSSSALMQTSELDHEHAIKQAAAAARRLQIQRWKLARSEVAKQVAGHRDAAIQEACGGTPALLLDEGLVPDEVDADLVTKQRTMKSRTLSAQWSDSWKKKSDVAAEKRSMAQKAAAKKAEGELATQAKRSSVALRCRSLSAIERERELRKEQPQRRAFFVGRPSTGDCEVASREHGHVNAGMAAAAMELRPTRCNRPSSGMLQPLHRSSPTSASNPASNPDDTGGDAQAVFLKELEQSCTRWRKEWHDKRKYAW